MSERRFAILIGNGTFDGQRSELENLRCPTRDIERLGQVLEDPAKGGFTRTTRLPDRAAQEVRRCLQQILQEATSEDLVVIYYSGHGKQSETGDLHLATADTEATLLESTSVPVSDIWKYIRKSRCRRVLFVLDCCYSGAVGDVVLKSGVADQLQVAAREGRGTYIITASTGIQVAMEREQDEHSLFTKHLIRGIETGEADRDGDGAITINELYEYVNEAVRRESPQEPTKWGIDVRGEFVLAKSGREPRRERADKIRRLLLQLASDDRIDLETVEPAVAIMRKPADQLTAQERSLDALLTQLASRDLTPVNFIQQWARTVMAPVSETVPAVPAAEPAPARPAPESGPATPAGAASRSPAPVAPPVAPALSAAVSTPVGSTPAIAALVGATTLRDRLGQFTLLPVYLGLVWLFCAAMGPIIYVAATDGWRQPLFCLMGALCALGTAAAIHWVNRGFDRVRTALLVACGILAVKLVSAGPEELALLGVGTYLVGNAAILSGKKLLHRWWHGPLVALLSLLAGIAFAGSFNFLETQAQDVSADPEIRNVLLAGLGGLWFGIVQGLLFWWLLARPGSAAIEADPAQPPPTFGSLLRWAAFGCLTGTFSLLAPANHWLPPVLGIVVLFYLGRLCLETFWAAIGPAPASRRRWALLAVCSVSVLAFRPLEAEQAAWQVFIVTIAAGWILPPAILGAGAGRQAIVFFASWGLLTAVLAVGLAQVVRLPIGTNGLEDISASEVLYLLDWRTWLINCTLVGGAVGLILGMIQRTLRSRPAAA